MQKIKLGIIGFGNMGKAIALGLLSKNILKSTELGIFDHLKENSDQAQDHGLICFHDEVECAENCEILLLAIKPQGFEELLNKLKSIQNQPVFLSIAAGISTTYIQQYFTEAKVVRCMPNTPLMISEGATALCRTSQVNDEEFKFIRQMFDSLGKTCVLDENQLNNIIAVSGSTPAYVYYFLDCIAKDAAKRGIEYDTALMMAAQTFIGASELILKKDHSAEDLIQMVCSKGGATIEAMNVLRDRHIEQIISDANTAAIDRAIVIGK